ncbi:MAG: DNA translocase FtsK, partial [archaeon]|nr:DNA translocase FtsK [archaeon]
AQLLMGKAVFLLPFFLILGALILWGMRRHTLLLVWVGLLLLVVGVTGVLGVLADSRGTSLIDGGGWIGFAVSWPVIGAFGFWVSEIIFAILIVIAGVLFWQLLPHEDVEGTSFVQGARDKAKKIFEPTFDVEEVDPSPKAQSEDAGKQKKKGKEEKILAPIPQMIGDYKFPEPNLLESEKGLPNAGDVKVYSAIIKKTLANFDIAVEISEVNIGPTVTQYAFKPAEGIKLSRITGLQNDLSLALAAHPIRIEAPIPGRALVGIEIPNKTRATVRLRSLLETPDFQNSPSRLLAALGRDVAGSPVFVDLARMPHTMVAGATGAGKTIGLSNIILSLVARNSPDTLR